MICHVRSSTGEIKDWATALGQKTKTNITILAFDIACEDEIKRAMAELFREIKRLDILVNNAGITHNAFVQMTRVDELHEQLAINTVGPFLITQLACKKMVRAKSEVSSILHPRLRWTVT